MMEQGLKKTRFKGAQELKALASFDVKFKDSGKKSRGRSLMPKDP